MRKCRVVLAAASCIFLVAASAWAADNWKPFMLAAQKLRGDGQYDAAAIMARKALAAARRDYGPAHPFVKTSLLFLIDLAHVHGWKAYEAYYGERLYEYEILAARAALEKTRQEFNSSMRPLVDAVIHDGIYEFEAEVGSAELRKMQTNHLPELRRLADETFALGDAYTTHDPGKAAALMRGALHLLRDTAPATDPTAIQLHYRLAEVALQQNDIEEAGAEYRLALEGLRASHEADRYLAIAARLALARVYIEELKTDEVDRLAHEAQARYDKAPPTENKFLQAEIYFIQSVVALQRGDLAGAEALNRKQLAFAEDVGGPATPEVASALVAQASVLLMLQRPRDANPLLRRALAIQEETLGPESLDVAGTLGNLGQSYLFSDDPALAEPCYVRALSIRVKIQGPEHQNTVAVMAALFLTYVAQKKQDRADAMIPAFSSLMDKYSEKPWMAKVMVEVADGFAELGKTREAIGILSKAVPVLEKDPGLPNDPEGRGRVEEAKNALKELTAPETDEGAAADAK